MLKLHTTPDLKKETITYQLRGSRVRYSGPMLQTEQINK